jgi:hypothetical protein
VKIPRQTVLRGLNLYVCDPALMCKIEPYVAAKTHATLQISAAKRPARIGLTRRLYKEFGRGYSWGAKNFKGGGPISGEI